MLVVFSSIFVADIKIIFRYYFVAPLMDVRDKFSKHASVDHCLVVEHLKAKMELEENEKKKFESPPLARKNIKLAGRVGVASKARKFSSNIKITEEDLKDLTKKKFKWSALE